MKAFVLFLLALSAACPLHSKPNVLFIAVDDLRPDLGCYGVGYAKTPNIDRIAARGIVFDRAYCAQAVCSPSRTAILTGLRPDATKVWDLETHFRDAQPDCVTLPQHFRAHGYHTTGLGKIEHHGFEDGRSWSDPRWFASGETVSVDPDDWTKHSVTHSTGVGGEYVNPVSPEEAPKLPGRSKKAKRGPAFEVSPKSDDELPDGATAAEAVKRLAALKAAGEPFFLAVGFIKPHLPFVAPKKYWDLHDPETIPLPATDRYPEGTPDFVGHTNGELHAYIGVPKEDPIPADFAKTLRHGYHACISYTDAQIGRLLDALKQEGLADQTVIVLWGDHGWQLGDHGLWHKHTNFELATRAPLLIAAPGTSTAGRHCAAPVEFVDVYPTLADVCGLTVPSGLAGRSLKPYLENPDAPMQKPAISIYPKYSKDHGGALMGYSVRTERWRATYWRKRNAADIGFVELYDEQNDPAETVNLASLPEHAELIASLQAHLPPTGSDFQPPKSGKTAKNISGSGAADPNESREQRYDRLYPGKPKLTLEEYLAGQSKSDAAVRERFAKMDANKDGFMTREEFIGTRKK